MIYTHIYNIYILVYIWLGMPLKRWGSRAGLGGFQGGGYRGDQAGGFAPRTPISSRPLARPPGGRRQKSYFWIKNIFYFFRCYFPEIKSACGRAPRRLVLVFLWRINSGKPLNEKALFHEKGSKYQKCWSKMLYFDGLGWKYDGEYINIRSFCLRRFCLMRHMRLIFSKSFFFPKNRFWGGWAFSWFFGIFGQKWFFPKMNQKCLGVVGEHPRPISNHF